MKSLIQYLTELSNETMASYKRKAKRHLRHRKDESHPYSRHGYYGIEFLRNPNLGPKREQGINTAEKKLQMRYVHLKEVKESEEKERLERISSPNVDLITFPKGVIGTNCGNCKYFDNNYCKNKNVLSAVTDHMCCNLWDHEGTTRQWANK